MSREGRRRHQEDERQGRYREREVISQPTEKAEFWTNKMHQADWDENGIKEVEKET